MWHCKVVNLETKQAVEFVYDTLDSKEFALRIPFILKEFAKVPVRCYVKYVGREAK